MAARRWLAAPVGGSARLAPDPERTPDITSAKMPRPNPLYAPICGDPPSGNRPPPRLSTVGSVVGAPLSSSAHPSGMDAPRLAAISSLPPATTLVEPSSTSWKSLPVGAATLITLAPYTGLLAPGGTTMFPPVVMG